MSVPHASWTSYRAGGDFYAITAHIALEWASGVGRDAYQGSSACRMMSAPSGRGGNMIRRVHRDAGDDGTTRR